MTDSTPPRKIGHWWAISAMKAGLMPRAAMQPTKPCASTNAGPGMRADPSAVATRIAAAIGPSSRAAGRRAASSIRTNGADSSARTAHCAASGAPSSEGKRLRLRGSRSSMACFRDSRPAASPRGGVSEERGSDGRGWIRCIVFSRRGKHPPRGREIASPKSGDSSRLSIAERGQISGHACRRGR
jgi:hypothetical protein